MATERSAPELAEPTVVVAVAELLEVEGSFVEEDTLAVFVMTLPLGVTGFTFTTNVKDELASSAMLGSAQLTGPVPPTDGIEQVQPGAPLKETNVVFDGVASENVTLVAVVGPPFATTIVYVMFDPAATGSGESDSVTDRLAPGTANAGRAQSNSTPAPARIAKVLRIVRDVVTIDRLLGRSLRDGFHSECSTRFSFGSTGREPITCVGSLRRRP